VPAVDGLLPNVIITGATEVLAETNRPFFRVRWMMWLGKIFVFSLLVRCQWLGDLFIPYCHDKVLPHHISTFDP
jgi:hypothetical protein